jgi:hypothetical protein
MVARSKTVPGFESPMPRTNKRWKTQEWKRANEQINKNNIREARQNHQKKNNYVCPIWIFMFDTDQAQISSVLCYRRGIIL